MRYTVYVWVFCGYFFACYWIYNKAMKYWHILYLFTFFSENMNLIPNQTISAATLFEVFRWWINEKEMPVVCLWSTCIRVTTIWIKILLLCSNLACTIITSATKTNLKSLRNYSNHYFLFLFIHVICYFKVFSLKILVYYLTLWLKLMLI